MTGSDTRTKPMLHLIAEYGDGSQDVVVLQRMSIGSGEGDTIEIPSLMPAFALIVRLADGSFVLKTNDPEQKVIDDASGAETSEVVLNEGVAVRLGDCRLRCVPASRVSSPSGEDAFESDWQDSCPFCNGAMVDESVTECSSCGNFSQGLKDGRVPLRLGAYQVVAWVGTGGMGIVLQGVSDSHIPVALKLIRSKNPSISSIQRFEEEIRLTGDIPRHPNVIYQESHGTVGKLRWLAIEWISGQTLAQRLVETIGKMEIDEIRRIMLQLVEGLKHLHAHQVIHRDLKPSNVFVRPDGGVKIGDFGLSMACGTVTRATMTRTGAVIGTERYMSPEQHKGHLLTEASDLYSLGLIWLEMLTDYCTGGLISINRKDCPASWKAAIGRLLDTAPERRPSLDEFETTLRKESEEELAEKKESSLISGNIPAAIAASVIKTKIRATVRKYWQVKILGAAVILWMKFLSTTKNIVDRKKLEYSIFDGIDAHVASKSLYQVPFITISENPQESDVLDSSDCGSNALKNGKNTNNQKDDYQKNNPILGRFFCFKGRAGRREFWIVAVMPLMLMLMLIMFTIVGISNTFSGMFVSSITFLFLLFIFWLTGISIPIAVRRYRDLRSDVSGNPMWDFLILLVISFFLIVSQNALLILILLALWLIILLILGIASGGNLPNKHGLPPEWPRSSPRK